MTRTPRLHIPHPPARPGSDPDFSYIDLVPAGGSSTAGSEHAVTRHAELADLRHGARAGRRRSRRGSVGSAARPARPPGWPPAHAGNAALRRAHAQDAAPGENFVLHEVSGRRSGLRGGRDGLAAERHAVPVLPQPGPADHAWAQLHGPDVSVPVEQQRHVQGPPDADHVPLAPRQHLLRVRQPDHPVSAGRGLGHGRGHQGRGRHRRVLDRRRDPARKPTFITR